MAGLGSLCARLTEMTNPVDILVIVRVKLRWDIASGCSGIVVHLG